jgi:molybdopterin converting factor subunit 1
MKITVQLFAILREAAGASQLDLEVPAGTTARQIAQMLAERFPKFRAHLHTLSFAVNNEIVPANTKVVNASEIALLPPVSGG